MHFLLTYKLDIHTAASSIYSFLAISSIHPKDVNRMQDSLSFSAKYSALIYCNVLYTIEISLHQYSTQHFNNPIFPPETLTDIIKRFTNTYCKNTAPFISSHLLLLRLFAFGIHKRMFHPPSIIVLNKEKALIRCNNVELDLKNKQRFFKKVTREAHNQLCSDLLLGMTLQDWPELTCQEFAQWEDFSNKNGETSFLDLALSDMMIQLNGSSRASVGSAAIFLVQAKLGLGGFNSFASSSSGVIHRELSIESHRPRVVH